LSVLLLDDFLDVRAAHVTPFIYRFERFDLT